MMFTLNLVAGEAEWSRALMIGWLAIALILSAIEVFWLKGGKALLKHQNYNFLDTFVEFRSRHSS